MKPKLLNQYDRYIFFSKKKIELRLVIKKRFSRANFDGSVGVHQTNQFLI